MTENSLYRWRMHVDGFPKDNVDETGTLLELAHRWTLIHGLIYHPDGTLDHSMLEEPVYMRLRVGIALFILAPVEEG